LLDPKASFWVPRNVSRAVNFYIPQTGTAVAAGSGFHGSLTNINVGGVPGRRDSGGRRNRPHLDRNEIGVT